MRSRFWLYIFCSLLVCVSSGLYSDEITRYYRHSVYTFFDMFEPLFYEEISEEEALHASVTYEVTFCGSKVKTVRGIFRSIPEITGYLIIPPESLDVPNSSWVEISEDEIPAHLKENMPSSRFYVRKSELHPEDTDSDVTQKVYNFHYDDYEKLVQIDFDLGIIEQEHETGIINLKRITPEIYRGFFDGEVYFLVYDGNSLSKIIRYYKNGDAYRCGQKKVSQNEIIITERQGNEKPYKEFHYLLEDGKIISSHIDEYAIDD